MEESVLQENNGNSAIMPPQYLSRTTRLLYEVLNILHMQLTFIRVLNILYIKHAFIRFAAYFTAIRYSIMFSIYFTYNMPV